MSQVGVSEFANQPEVDWPWVKYHLFKKERIAANEAASQKGALLACTEECLKRGESLAAPRLVCAEKKITGFKSGNVEIAGFGALSSSSLASYINGAQGLYFFLVTIGSGIENTATKLMKDGEHLEGYILDRIGSFAVESLAENLEKQVREAYARKAYSASMRLSPGYCDWPIEEQFKLEKILDFSRAGVRLTENCMMVPKKSISGVIGIGPKGLFSGTKSQCVICKVRDCDYRREP